MARSVAANDAGSEMVGQKGTATTRPVVGTVGNIHVAVVADVDTFDAAAVDVVGTFDAAAAAAAVDGTTRLLVHAVAVAVKVARPIAVADAQLTVLEMPWP